MSAAIQRIQRLLRIREAQESEAAVGLAARLETVSHIEQQREQLETYQRETLACLLPDDAVMLRQLAKMREQVREALEQQELRLAAAHSQVEQARAIWTERHQASLSLEKLIERRRQQESIEEGRRLQREQDMWATRRTFDRLHEQ